MVFVFVQLEATDLAPAYRLLQMFCYGTWAEYKGDPHRLSR